MRNWASAGNVKVARNTSSWIKRIALITVCAIAVFNQARAADPVLFGAACNGPGGPASLYNIDPITGAPTLIGPIGFNRVNAISFDLSGTLYGVGNRVSDGVQVLLQINPATGAGTEVGSLTVSTYFQDISFRHGDNALYGYAGGDIYTFNLTTGVATDLGSTGDGFPSGNGLAFSPFDTLYKADNNSLWTINQSNGSGTTLFALSYPNADDRANGMVFDTSTGILWASVTSGLGGANYIANIDVDNGDVTDIGPTQQGLDSLSIAIATIPEPGTFTLVGMGLVGLLTFRRRKK